jgi:hypothetical protein
MKKVRRALALGLLAALPVAAGVLSSASLRLAAAGNGASGLSVFVGYAEDKETNTPDPSSFPTPWAGAPNTVFLGNPVPGGSASCGSLPICWDAGGIRLDNSGSTPVVVSSVTVDDHSAITGGNLFQNLWGSFTVPAGESAILTENPPANNPSYDNFDTSGYPGNNCTPIAIAPTVTITVAGVSTTLADSTHVLDTGGIDTGYCQPKHNESIQWRAIGAAGSNTATLTLAPTTVTAFTSGQASETATLLDGGGIGLPNTTVNYSVTSGPDTTLTGSAVTDYSGHATFKYSSAASGVDVLIARATTVGSFQSNPARVMWANDSSAGWSSADIGSATPTGTQSLNTTTGTWTVAGGGGDINGTSDQLHFLWQTLPGPGGVAARITSQTNTDPWAKAGVMLRSTSDPGSPYYAAFVTPSNGIVVQDRASQGGATVTLVNPAGAPPAYLWVADSGGTFAVFTSNDGYVWGRLPGSAATLNLGSTLLAGLAVTSRNSSMLSSATMDTVAVTASPPPPLAPVACPAPWSCADIGNPTPAGSQSFDANSGTWTINAGGADVTGTSDQFHFVWQSLSGDSSVSAHVTSQTNTSSSAKAGVMLRQTTNAASPYYAVLVSPGAGIKVQVRTVQGGNTTKLANPTGTVPAYLMVTTSGGTFSAFTSADGVTWTVIPGSTITLNLGSTLLAGLAVTSHNSGALGVVTMDTVVTS